MDTEKAVNQTTEKSFEDKKREYIYTKFTYLLSKYMSCEEFNIITEYYRDVIDNRIEMYMTKYGNTEDELFEHSTKFADSLSTDILSKLSSELLSADTIIYDSMKVRKFLHELIPTLYGRERHNIVELYGSENAFKGLHEYMVGDTLLCGDYNIKCTVCDSLLKDSSYILTDFDICVYELGCSYRIDLKTVMFLISLTKKRAPVPIHFLTERQRLMEYQGRRESIWRDVLKILNRRLIPFETDIIIRTKGVEIVNGIDEFVLYVDDGDVITPDVIINDRRCAGVIVKGIVENARNRIGKYQYDLKIETSELKSIIDSIILTIDKSLNVVVYGEEKTIKMLSDDIKGLHASSDGCTYVGVMVSGQRVVYTEVVDKATACVRYKPTETSLIIKRADNGVVGIDLNALLYFICLKTL